MGAVLRLFFTFFFIVSYMINDYIFWLFWDSFIKLSSLSIEPGTSSTKRLANEYGIVENVEIGELAEDVGTGELAEDVGTGELADDMGTDKMKLDIDDE